MGVTTFSRHHKERNVGFPFRAINTSLDDWLFIYIEILHWLEITSSYIYNKVCDWMESLRDVLYVYIKFVCLVLGALHASVFFSYPFKHIVAFFTDLCLNTFHYIGCGTCKSVSISLFMLQSDLLMCISTGRISGTILFSP